MERDNLMKLCGLPLTNETSHCFNDETHQTCCILGPKAREYADNSGNPIGKISQKLNPNKTLTPWCTCAGSQVCSYYSDKFKDGTHVKFMNDRKDKYNYIYNFEENPSYKEKDIANKIGINKHNTPGVF